MPDVYPTIAWHLWELMGVTKLYGWEPVGAFHAVWLKQLEHGWVTWDDKDATVKLRHALV